MGYSYSILLALAVTTVFTKKEESNMVQLEQQRGKIDIYIDGNYFTSYLYEDSILRKPVLFPIHTPSGTRVTRGYPFEPNPNERIDHPHHYGLWFNHGNVNGVDYWNSAVIPKDKNTNYGHIHHEEFIEINYGKTGTLKVRKIWKDHNGLSVINEITTHTFSKLNNSYVITHESELTALDEDVRFTDSKEGMLGIRVRKELEVPSQKKAIFLDDNLNPLEEKSINNKGVNGSYTNSEGLEGYPEVWGKRAKWVNLSGVVDSSEISITILDHPKNINHPPRWHARDYGLFSVNPFGDNQYSDGQEELNYLLESGKTINFIHQVVITEGQTFSSEETENMFLKFKQ